MEALSDGEAFQNISFSIRSGEIFGIAGLIGSGRQELIDCLYGLRRIKHGHISRVGKTVKIGSAAQAVRHGIVLVPRDRRNDGLVLPMNVAENITLAIMDRVSFLGLFKKAVAKNVAAKQIEKLDIRPADPELPARYLSGGNQQKVVLGRWLAQGCRDVHS